MALETERSMCAFLLMRACMRVCLSSFRAKAALEAGCVHMQDIQCRGS